LVDGLRPRAQRDQLGLQPPLAGRGFPRLFLRRGNPQGPRRERLRMALALPAELVRCSSPDWNSSRMPDLVERSSMGDAP
jgi:hypothetical protein